MDGLDYEEESEKDPAALEDDSKESEDERYQQIITVAAIFNQFQINVYRTFGQFWALCWPRYLSQKVPINITG